MTVAEENYLKAIYKLAEAEPGEVSTNRIAAALATRAASVTDMLRRLSEKGLLDYERYRGVQLTAEGRRCALLTIRKHRLWEVFLVQQLGFSNPFSESRRSISVTEAARVARAAAMRLVLTSPGSASPSLKMALR